MTTTIHDLPLRRRRRRRTRGLVFLLVLLVALLPVSVAVGTLTIPIDVTWDAIISFNPDSPAHLLVRHNRIPRTLLAILVGGALGVAGLIMQALTRNPLADPGILGINAGAAVAVAAAISVFGITGAAGYMWFGLAGAVLAGIAVYLLGGVRRGTDPIQLALSGSRCMMLFDGRRWIDLGLRRALQAELDNPPSVLLIDSGDMGHRARDLPDPIRAATLLEQCLAAAEADGRTVAPAAGRIVAGQSFGGLAAASIVVHRPDLAQTAICQSGSFWYRDGDRSRMAEPGTLTGRVGAMRGAARFG